LIDARHKPAVPPGGSRDRPAGSRRTTAKKETASVRNNDEVGAADDTAHHRPAGVDDATVAAVGKVSEALEWLERARGRLYDFHQMIGHLDFQMSDAVQMLHAAGHTELAELLDRDVVGRNVLDGRWTFQIIEEFETVYYDPIRAADRRVRDELMAGRRHVYESEMKEARRSRGVPGHDSRPPAPQDHDDQSAGA
jgi:hypothetical protein